MKKIAFVCQRYGLEVNGGAELLCRQLAEKLAERYEVEVYTTCAIDYITWRNEYQPGKERIRGVLVRRFRSRKERSGDFDRFSGAVLTNPNHSDKDEDRWIEKQGPLCPALIDALKERADRYEAILFMTYLYYPTVRGLTLGLDNAYLIPTVHDELPVYLRCFDRVFAGAKGYIWNTPEERAFALRRFPEIAGKPDTVAGIGVQVPDVPLPELPEAIQGVPYLVYAGRIEEGKGCGRLFSYFREYKRRRGGPLKLVLMGKATMEIPSDPDIVALGFVPEEMKFAVMGGSLAFVLFSQFESLSVVVLESMAMGRPVIVNEDCEVLKGHCLRSGAGLYFKEYRDFAACVDFYLARPDAALEMGKRGVAYVRENYTWPVILEKYSALIEDAAPSGAAETSWDAVQTERAAAPEREGVPERAAVPEYEAVAERVAVPEREAVAERVAVSARTSERERRSTYKVFYFADGDSEAEIRQAANLFAAFCNAHAKTGDLYLLNSLPLGELPHVRECGFVPDDKAGDLCRGEIVWIPYHSPACLIGLLGVDTTILVSWRLPRLANICGQYGIGESYRSDTEFIELLSRMIKADEADHLHLAGRRQMPPAPPQILLPALRGGRKGVRFICSDAGGIGGMIDALLFYAAYTLKNPEGAELRFVWSGDPDGQCRAVIDTLRGELRIPGVFFPDETGEAQVFLDFGREGLSESPAAVGGVLLSDDATMKWNNRTVIVDTRETEKAARFTDTAITMAELKGK